MHINNLTGGRMRGISHQYIDGRITLARKKKKMYTLHLNHPPPCLLAVFRPPGHVRGVQYQGQHLPYRPHTDTAEDPNVRPLSAGRPMGPWKRLQVKFKTAEQTQRENRRAVTCVAIRNPKGRIEDVPTCLVTGKVNGDTERTNSRNPRLL